MQCPFHQLVYERADSEELEAKHRATLSSLADQSLCVLLALSTTQKWLETGKKASGDVKKLLDQVASQVQSKGLSLSHGLGDALTILT